MVSGTRKKPPAGVFRKYLEGIVVGASANQPEGEGDRGQAERARRRVDCRSAGIFDVDV